MYIPYTYLIGWSSLKKFYYGRRTAKGCNPYDLWNSYFTSSKVVKRYRNLYGEPNIIQVRQTFCKPEDCAKWESKVLKRIDSQHNKFFLNQKNGDEKWDQTGISQKNSLYILIEKMILFGFYNSEIRNILYRHPKHKIEHLICKIRRLTKIPQNKKDTSNVMSLRFKGKTGELCHNYGKFLSEEHKQKIRNGSAKKTYKALSPDGVEYTFTGLREFCIQHHLDSSSMVKVSKGKLQSTKGWKCEIFTFT